MYCLIFENAALAAQAAQFERDMALELQDEEGSFSIECLIFESQGQQLRALFKHGSFEVAERLLRYVERQKSGCTKFGICPLVDKISAWFKIIQRK